MGSADTRCSTHCTPFTHPFTRCKIQLTQTPAIQRTQKAQIICAGVFSVRSLDKNSGYGNWPKDFDDLIRILDSEIRLITPTDPEGKEIDNDSVSHTHCFLF